MRSAQRQFIPDCFTFRPSTFSLRSRHTVLLGPIHYAPTAGVFEVFSDLAEGAKLYKMILPSIGDRRAIVEI